MDESSPSPRQLGLSSGTHLIGDLAVCREAPLLRDPARIRSRCLSAVSEAGLHTVGELFYPFPGEGGVTGTVVLSESHLCIHTWPEFGRVSLDVYVCNVTRDNSARARMLFDALVAFFDPQEITFQQLERG